MIKSFKMFEGNKAIKQEIVVDVQYGNVPKEIKDEVFRIARRRMLGQNSFFTYCVPEEVKPKSEIRDPKNTIWEASNEYVYERGDEILTDWLLDEGIEFESEVTFKVWW